MNDFHNQDSCSAYGDRYTALAGRCQSELSIDVSQSVVLQGIQVVKLLRRMDTPLKQDAEIALYLKQFDEAESLYRRMDRPDLAIDMRMRLGDWFAVSCTPLRQLCSLTTASVPAPNAHYILASITTASSPLCLDCCFHAYCM